MATLKSFLITLAVASLVLAAPSILSSGAHGAELSSGLSMLGEDCDKQLDTENAIAFCVGGASGWTTCGSPPTSVDCCDHWHKAMSWQECNPAAGPTGKKCGDWENIKPALIEGYCEWIESENRWVCQTKPVQTCEVAGHWRKDYTLQDC